MPLDSIEDIIQDIKDGRMVILMDDEDRENEGDLIVAAEKVTEAHINFMAQYGRGLICLPMAKNRCEQLNLPLMSSNNNCQFGTKFTVSIEAREGVTTGISIADRLKTIQTAIADQAKPEDIATPGHIFPIMAQEGGVLARAGHTEASCDLATLAGYSPSAVICEILQPDGSMARRPELEVFAKEHNLKIGTVADLIRYRLNKEKTVQLTNEAILPTDFGHFQLKVYQDLIDQKTHLTLVMGTPNSSETTPVRIQVQDPVFDLPGSQMGHWAPGSARWPLAKAMEYIADQGHGVIILLGYEAFDTAALIEHVGMLGADLSVSKTDQEMKKDWRLIGVGSQILSDLGVSKLKILGKARKMHALSGFDLEIVDYLSYSEYLSNQ